MISFLILSAVGICACAFLDFWQRLLFYLFKVPPSNWALVGRWLIIFLRTRIWVQSNLVKQTAIKNELFIGWVFHYFVAVVYALLYLFLVNHNVINFGFADGVVFGLFSVIVPWFFFMPAMGTGILANKAPNPSLSCLLALMAHTIFGGALGWLFKMFY